MDNHNTPLGKAGFLVIPLAILLAVVFPSFWTAVSVGAATGFFGVNVRAVLFVGRMRQTIGRNPLLGLQAAIEGAGTSAQIRFIFFQSLIGALVVALFTAIASGAGALIR